MKLVYLSKNRNKYIIINQSYPSHLCEIGEYNKRGHLLLYVKLLTSNKTYILYSWSDYYRIINENNQPTIIDRYKNFKKGVKHKFAYKLRQLAFKIEKI